MSKPRVIKDYAKLPEIVLEQIKLAYPRGFTDHLVSFTTKDGERKLGLPFETDDFYYLIKMSKSAAELIIEDDDDFDEDGVLRDEVRNSYRSKHEELEYINSEDEEEEEDSFGSDDKMMV